MSAVAELMTALSALISAFGAFFAALAHRQAKESRRHAAEANDAVNHSRERGTPRLFDVVLEVRDDVKRLDARVSELEGKSLR